MIRSKKIATFSRFVNQISPSPSQNRGQEGQAMTEPAKRIPDWLTTDVLVIVVGLALIGVTIWIAP